MGVVPGVLDARGERLAGPIFTGVGLAALAACVLWGPGVHGATLVVVVVTAVFVPLLIPVFRYRRTHPWLAAAYYAGVLAAATLLVTRDDTFMGFASFGYPLAFVLFPARWGFFAVAATATLPLLAANSDSPSPTWVLVLSMAGPLLYAAWFVGVESEQRRKANVRLEAALDENASLHAQLVARAREAGVLDERQRLAREIHDTLAQGLTGIVTQLEAADGPERERRLARVRELARDSLGEARRAVQALRPEPLDAAQLPEALSELARRVAETSGAAVEVETTGEIRPLLPELEVTLYRVAQEALANAEKHAKASRIGLTLSYADDLVLLDVVDDGVGFRPGDRGDGTGFGLEAMRRRVQRVAGTLTVESTPGDGTAVSAQVPAL
ncbi:Signal transduction histidine kinase [Amycolatopsis pretoriensis]|uniref:Oxygen sensor histidine kinase NreB n=1 Tax=Amycolatopsis pretoriensis TaxID=218821 RepID=A0A1H5RC48_9PSEU|nr:sensor histidine kinase [Amycolatopsis pretoriensis]SEF35939.1 Signal transduction histidine kinase [Amycolatopsis pretoriensis]